MRRAHCLCLLALALGFAGCKPAPVLEPTPAPSAPPALVLEDKDAPAIALPPPPELPPAAKDFLFAEGGRDLVLEFETGGRSGYDPHPEWPKGASGVTIGIGYDLGYYKKSVIDADWIELENTARARLQTVAGLTGTRAANALSSVRSVYVSWPIATRVFDNVDVAREFSNAKKAMPGFEDLRPNAQAAIISLGFNRGWGMSGPNRGEMRAIRDLVPRRDYEGMSIQFKKMIRVWTGTAIEKGMTRRRLAEAKLILTP